MNNNQCNLCYYRYLIRAGDLDLYDNTDGAKPIDVEIEEVKIHENYSRSPIVNDIAILTLREPAKGCTFFQRNKIFITI